MTVCYFCCHHPTSITSINPLKSRQHVNYNVPQHTTFPPNVCAGGARSPPLPLPCPLQNLTL